MYQLIKSDFGKYERFSLTNKTTGIGVDFVPSMGACLLGLQFNGIEVTDGYTTPEELDFNKWGKGVLLFPFPNRLKDGKYTWKGQQYQFPINETFTNNSLHGFGMAWPMSIVDQELNLESGMVKMEGQYDGSFPYYPWSFTVGLTYQLSDSNGLEVSFYFKNDSDKEIPVGMGWHPYFQLDGGIEKNLLQLPDIDLIGIDKRMIPTGKRYAFDEFKTEKVIGSTVLDNCFAIRKTGTNISAYLSGASGQLHYWQETGDGKFNFLQVFTPPHRTCIALEPMSCNVDAFNNGDGLISLKAGETFDAKTGVKFKPSK